MGSNPYSQARAGKTQYAGYEDTLNDLNRAAGITQIYGHRPAALGSEGYSNLIPLESSVEFTGGELSAVVFSREDSASGAPEKSRVEARNRENSIELPRPRPLRLWE